MVDLHGKGKIPRNLKNKKGGGRKQEEEEKATKGNIFEEEERKEQKKLESAIAIAMGTCMSKDKRSAAAAAASLPSSTQPPPPPHCQLTSPPPQNQQQQLLPPSSEPISTDKHVVQILLPISSPRHLVTSPSSSLPVARSTVSHSISPPSSPFHHLSPPHHHPSALLDSPARSSFPLARSPSVTLPHSALSRTQSIRFSSPLKAGLHVASRLQSSMVDGFSSNRSRSLPKRFYSREPEFDLPFHKRSSSRDFTMEPVSAGRKPPPSLRRIPSMDFPFEIGLPPRMSVRREEASGEYRVYARHSAARKSHNFEPHSVKAPENLKSRKKEKSPLRRSSTGKVADADQLYSEHGRCQDDQNLEQASQMGAARRDHMTGRSVLKDKSVNCSYGWDTVSQQASLDLCKPPKNGKTAMVADSKTAENSLSRSSIGQELREVDSLTEVLDTEPIGALEELQHIFESRSSCYKRSLYLPSQSLFDSSNAQLPSEDFDLCSASMANAHLILQEVADLNLATSLYSEVEESENELLENEAEILQYALDPELSPKKRVQAQQARKLLLKEAAMDAFARTSFDGTLNSGEVEESKPPGLAALMARKLEGAEADTLEIRKVLKLLSLAEPAMKPEQKAAFYNQLRMLLDTVRMPDWEGRNPPNEGFEEKVVTCRRVNSWPRNIKQQTHDEVTHKAPMMTGLAPQLVTHLNKDFNKSIKVLHNAGNFPPTDDSLLAELSSGNPSSITKPIDDHTLDSEEHNTLLDNGRSLLHSDMNSNLKKVSCLDSNSEEQYEHFELDQADEKPISAHLEGKNGDLICLEGLSQISMQLKQERMGSDLISDTPALDGPRTSFAIDEDNCKSGHEKVCPHDKDAIESAPIQIYHGGLNCESVDTEAKPIFIDKSEIQPPTSMLAEFQSQVQSTTMECTVDSAEDSVPCGKNAAPSIEAEKFPANNMKDILFDDNRKSPSDAASDGSFEFRARSTASTPLSTPSTPMISTSSTPRQLNHLNPALTADEIAEIWDAFECS